MTECETSWISVKDLPIEGLAELCRGKRYTVYGILDACDEPTVPIKAHELGSERVVSLYQGAANRDYWAIAPYLFQIDEKLLQWIVDELWKDSWGIFVIAPLDLKTLRRHLRHFLLVKDPDGEELYFRFYDPRVLTSFITSFNDSEAKTFFGECQAFAVPADQDEPALVQFEFDPLRASRKQEASP